MNSDSILLTTDHLLVNRNVIYADKTAETLMPETDIKTHCFN